MERFLSRALDLAGRHARTDMRYLVSAGVWTNLTTVSVSLFSLLLYIVFANLLAKETFGTYQYLLSLALLLSSLTFTGMNAAVTKSVAQGHEGSLRASVRFQLRWIWVPVAASLAGSAYYAFQGNAVLAIGLVIVGAGMALTNAYNTYSAFLLGKQDFRKMFLYNLGINVPFYGALIICAFLTEDPLILLGAHMLVQAAGYAIAYVATLRAYRPNADADPSVIPYGTHMSATNVPGVIAQSLDTVLAFHFLGPVGVALYVFATAVPERVSGLFKFLPVAAMPRFALRSMHEVRETIAYRLLIAAFALVAAAVAYALAAPYLFAIFFPAYMEAVPYSQWYSLIMLTVLTQIVVAALTAQERLKSLYIYGIASPALMIALQAAGVMLFGLFGLVVGKLIGALASFALAFGLLYVKTSEDVAR